MTTSIEVSFGANSGDVSQAQIPVEVIDAKMGTAWRGTTTLSGRTTVTVSEPGVYLVRATLPSGDQRGQDGTPPVVTSLRDAVPSLLAT